MANPRVLIVDDEKPLAKAIAVKLAKLGIEATVLFDGTQVVAELQKQPYALLLLDLMMPGKDGWAVLEEIRTQQIPVIVFITSNLSQDEDIKRAKALGAVEFIVKSENTLEGIAQKVLAQIGAHG